MGTGVDFFNAIEFVITLSQFFYDAYIVQCTVKNPCEPSIFIRMKAIAYRGIANKVSRRMTSIKRQSIFHYLPLTDFLLETMITLFVFCLTMAARRAGFHGPLLGVSLFDSKSST